VHRPGFRLAHYVSRQIVSPLRACAAVAGTTYLVGSGPGGMDNLTIRASRLIASADVLVVDAVSLIVAPNQQRAIGHNDFI
jgi:Tetrapyrrole (Corrin/Porphyrin) Methylases